MICQEISFKGEVMARDQGEKGEREAFVPSYLGWMNRAGLALVFP
jgi:hypothetical protein